MIGGIKGPNFSTLVASINAKKFWVRVAVIIICLSAIFFWYYLILAQIDAIQGGGSQQISVDKKVLDGLMIKEEERNVEYSSSSLHSFDPFVSSVSSSIGVVAPKAQGASSSPKENGSGKSEIVPPLLQ